MIKAFTAILQRDLRIAMRRLADVSNPLIFFIIIATLFPLAITPDPKLLHSIAPGVIWVAALLASLLALDRLFQSDYDDGSLEQMLLSPQPLTLLTSAKILAHWLVTGLPLLLLSPILAFLFNLSLHEWWVLVACLALGTPVLSLLGSVCTALTVGLGGRGVLLALLILPLYIPVLIFATSAMLSASMGLPVVGHLALLGAIFVLTLMAAPFATAAALRIGLSL